MAEGGLLKGALEGGEPAEGGEGEIASGGQALCYTPQPFRHGPQKPAKRGV